MLLIAYGTRPEYIKLQPLFVFIKEPYRVLFTGQHPDLVDGDADIVLRIRQGGNRLDTIARSILGRDHLFDRTSRLLIQGDTTSAFIMALTAFHRHVPVIHLEAGLRTYDVTNPYPEEFNRVAIDRMSSVLFCPTPSNKWNLDREGITTGVHVTGNTGLDSLKGLNTTYGDTVFCTMHRRENLPDMKDWFQVLTNLATTFRSLKFVLPLHPNPAILRLAPTLKDHVAVHMAMSHDNVLNILKDCRFVITDSGGVQEEASFLNKRAFICRKKLERTECVGKTSVHCPTPKVLLEEFYGHIDNYEVQAPCPYGDGHASERVANILEEDLQ